jgi:hypothetical protein
MSAGDTSLTAGYERAAQPDQPHASKHRSEGGTTMDLMQSPDTLVLIHRAMELERIGRRHYPPYTAQASGTPMTALRANIGRALIVLGMRIAPTARTNRSQPETGTLSVAR